MKSVLALFLAFGIANPAYAVDFNSIERGRIRATWANAQAWAHFLVMSDLLQSVGSTLTTLEAGTLGRQESSVIEQKMAELSIEYDKIANYKNFNEEDLKKIVSKHLGQYRQLIMSQFDLSWKPAVKTYNTKYVVGVIKSTLRDFDVKCKNGRSDHGIDVEVAPVDVPSLGMGVTFSPSLETVVSATAHFSSGSESSDWQKHKGPLRMMITMVLSYVFPPAAVIFEIIFTIVDSFISQHETNKLKHKYAAALAQYHSARARGGDVSRLYREYCSVASEGLSFITKILEGGPDVQAQIAYAKTDTFASELQKWVANEKITGEAICRVGLQDSATNKKCLSWNTPQQKPKIIEEPVCRKYSLGGLVTDFPYKTEHHCPLIEVNEESNCRITEDKKLLRNMVYGCEVPAENYDCSPAHIQDLRTSGLESDAIFCESKPQREAEEARIKAEMEAKTLELIKKCQLNAAASTGNNYQENCEHNSRRTVELEYEKIKGQLEVEEIERYRKMETERAEQRVKLREKVIESAEIVGLYTVRTLDEQRDLIDRIASLEATMGGKRLAARERLLRMIRLIEMTMNTKLDAEAREYRALLIMQRDFVRIAARVIQNIMLGKHNLVEYGELSDLMRATQEFSSRNPLARSFTLTKSIEKVMSMLGTSNEKMD